MRGRRLVDVRAGLARTDGANERAVDYSIDRHRLSS
jgi:hypothetical protein